MKPKEFFKKLAKKPKGRRRSYEVYYVVDEVKKDRARYTNYKGALKTAKEWASDRGRRIFIYKKQVKRGMVYLILATIVRPDGTFTDVGEVKYKLEEGEVTS